MLRTLLCWLKSRFGLGPLGRVQTSALDAARSDGTWLRCCTVPSWTVRTELLLVHYLVVCLWGTCRGYIVALGTLGLDLLSLPFLFSSSHRGRFPSSCALHSFSFAVVSILLISVDTDLHFQFHSPPIESRHSIVVSHCPFMFNFCLISFTY